MKNIARILTIIILLVLASNIYATAEPYNYREVWNSWTDYQRYIYLWGFKDARENIGLITIAGIIKEFMGGKVLSIYELKEIINLTSEIDLLEPNASITDYEELNVSFKPPDLKVIRDIMTDLYKDPANAYISFENMIFIAIKKLKGEKVESILEEKRKSVIKSEELIEKLLKKQKN